MKRMIDERDTEVERLDVRPLLAQGESPLGVILDAVQRVGTGKSLLVVAPFEPFPLYQLLAEQGYGYEAKMTDDGSWEILFSPVSG
ncbi:DUF2249 domain-containing protein [Pelagicoccus sp. NFK12]|uniref:DUF2249 domain-containing protein n=1 Tax=Pelagicoccus enzymogenes TaxID=2773457 RepID=A0A927F9Q7_9BACT|nr:DUF2249 domain-containing protein [Pelagicoccus enzymogenes]MBD5779765.1 DUF2249 domain-containing protein [Pelagicoccus enzymogenes]